MQSCTASVTSVLPRIRPRTALVVSSDCSFRQRLKELLGGLRWQVRAVESGAQAWAEAERETPEAMILDTWLPDLNRSEFLAEFRGLFSEVEVLTVDDDATCDSPRGPHRNELLYALHRVQETDTASWNAAPALEDPDRGAAENTSQRVLPAMPRLVYRTARVVMDRKEKEFHAAEPTPNSSAEPDRIPSRERAPAAYDRIPELIGNAPCMLEISRRVRLVAARSTSVLIEGPTGSGKEVVAQVLHRLSKRTTRPFVAINCAAIPEELLEAELFGHTRGAFTGAVKGRVGRIEAADGGTLLLDEIGEMPLALQAKLLRFVESGELQRIGDNETVRVDVRILAATHCPLAQLAAEGKFRADLYYRLAVFLIHTPALADHMQDLPPLVEHFLEKMGRDGPVKGIAADAMTVLAAHDWPGNVRELQHVLERAAIMADEEPVMTAQEIDFGTAVH